MVTQTDGSRDDRFQVSISGSPIPKFSIFGSKSDMYLHTYWDLDSGVVLFKPYKLWDNLDRFDPGGLHAFKRTVLDRDGSGNTKTMI